MFLFFLTIWATTILANPFPIDSNDIVSKNLDASESSTLSQDAPIVKTHPDDWPIQQNVLLTGTIPLISSDINCPTDTSTDNINEENSILRRQRPRACASSEPKKNNVISPGDATSNQRQAGEPETSTSTEEKICKDPEQSVHVYCGGETVGDPILIVTNCVSGKLFEVYINRSNTNPGIVLRTYYAHREGSFLPSD